MWSLPLLLVFCGLLPVIWATTTTSTTVSSCVDRSPYCNQNDCTVRPGYAREFCRKTCGNCKDFCENSKFVACTEERKTECDAMLKDYCPMLCGVCRLPKKGKGSTTTTTTTSTTSVPTTVTQNFSVRMSTEQMKMTTPFVMPPMFRSSMNRIPSAMESNHVNYVDDVPQIEETSRSAGYLPEPPQPVPIQVALWAPHTTGYFPPPPSSPTLRRSPPRSFYPQQPLSPSHHGEPLYGPDPRLQALVSLLGCRDRDPSTCSRITDETCLSRPGFYLKLCPVRCRNCDGLQCFDSIKVDCEAVRRAGGCRLAAAGEYCPRTCQLCSPPPALADSLSICRDELDTCVHLAEGGLCESGDGDLLRIYCARSCGFCKAPQFYTHSPFMRKRVKKA